MVANNIKQKNTDHLFKPGQSGNYNGRPIESTEKKLIRKANKQFIAEYLESLTQALVDISPVLIAKAIDGDMMAIKEVNDRAIGKALQKSEVKQEITLVDEEVKEKINNALDNILDN